MVQVGNTNRDAIRGILNDILRDAVGDTTGGTNRDGTNDTMNILQGLEEISIITQEINQIAQASALYQSQIAYNMALIEADGIAAQLEINQFVSDLNVQADISQLRTRGQLLLASKAMETSVLIAQFREKMLSMFIQIMEQRTTSVWGRMKTLTQGFKF